MKEIEKMETIKDYLLKSFDENADKLAFIVKHNDEKKEIKFSEFKEMILNLAAGLESRGYKNKKVMVISKNSFEYILTAYTCMFAGITLVPVDVGLTETEISNTLKKSEADAVFADADRMEMMKKLVVENGTTSSDNVYLLDIYEGETAKLIEEGKLKAEKKEEILNRELLGDDMALLIFTSGTTSLAKAVILTQNNVASNIYGVLKAVQISSDDRTLAILPLHHSYGLTGVLVFTSAGSSIAFIEGLKQIKKNLLEYSPTFLFAVPALIEAILSSVKKEIKKQNKEGLVKVMLGVTGFLSKLGINLQRKIFASIHDNLGGNLRTVVSAAAPIDKEVLKEFEGLGFVTLQGYGLTETSPVVSCERFDEKRLGSVGKAIDSTEVKILNPDEDGIGEIHVKGPGVFPGYYNEPEKTAEALKDGWFNTGDLGYIKDDYIFLTGREKDMIVLKNGKKIFPEEVETLVKKYPYVTDVLVFGQPKNDDFVLTAKVNYDEEYIKENHPELDTEEKIREKIWNDIKTVNKLLPNYKYIRDLMLTNEDFAKTTTLKTKRNVELKKMGIEK